MPSIILYVLLLLTSFGVSAQLPFKHMKDTSAFKIKVDKMSKETNSIESDFTQIKDLKMLSEKIVSKGKFVFMKQNNLRWEYLEPYRYVIVINKDKILIKDENNKIKKYDMNANKVFKEINDIMISCVNGDVLRSNKFRITYFENEKQFKLELTPTVKTMQESLKTINMYFDKSVSSVVKIEMIEPGNDITTIDFSNKKLNAAVSPQTFILK
ncbi:MAG: outer membrane lipoprotein carrier protein LolA [bacterium]|nr:outer membrane lipoprotein carrier protein LolA [bacterium]